LNADAIVPQEPHARRRAGASAPAAQPSAVEWLRRLGAGEVSSRELVEAYLARIEAVNGVLNAAVVRDPERALVEAGAADDARRRGDDGTLLGLPVTIKDSLDVAGLVSAGGSLARRDHVPEEDATAVARLRSAGAVVIAKTNAPEYSCAYETDNLVYGRTSNPHDPERTAGGSSGGEAALAAADATPAGLGTDGLGSIRVPAHYCGVLGLRPTSGRVPETGNWPATRASGYLDCYCVGPIVRYAEDAALLLRTVAGPDGVDPYAVPAPLADPADVDVGRLRVGVFTRSARLASTSGTVAAIEAAAGALADAGASVEELEPPWEPNPTELAFAAIVADGGAQMRADTAAAEEQYHPWFRGLLEQAAPRALSAAGWFALQAEIYGLRRRLRLAMQQLDVLLGPVVAGPAPPHGRPPAGLPDEEYGDYRAFDAVHLVALAGLPAAAVPAGVEGGLPVGVQAVAAPFREDVVLAVGEHLAASVRPFAPAAVAT
jgi:amidase